MYSQIILFALIWAGSSFLYSSAWSQSKIQDDNISIQRGDILISEFLFDPTPQIGLPEAEYIELYNATDQVIDIGGVKLNTSNLPAYLMHPNEFLVFCNISEIIQFEGIPAIGLQNWDPLNNDGQSIQLRNNVGDLISGVTYDRYTPHNPEKQKGGWSIELSNDKNNCIGSSDWQYALHVNGGTPGMPNSYQKENSDSPAFKLIGYNQTSPVQMQLKFNKPLRNISTQNNLDISISDGISIVNIESEDIYYETITLTLKDSMIYGQVYEISPKHIISCTGEELGKDPVQVGIGKSPDFNEILVTEIFADVSPTQGLPEYEYLELYNPSEFIISTGDIILSIGDDTLRLPEKNLFPDQYYLIVENRSASFFDESINKIIVGNLPAIVNDGEAITIFSAIKDIIFTLKFDKSWYHDVNKTNGGYSLEMIDSDNPCGGYHNWHGSMHPKGGTPGGVNSVRNHNPDLTRPTLSNVYPFSIDSVLIQFSEKIRFNSNDPIEILVSGIPVRSGLKDVNNQLEDFILKIPQTLDSGISYSLEIQNVFDCVFNALEKGKTTWALQLPEEILENDILINEILFNPRPGGADWIEIVNASKKYIDLGQMLFYDSDLSILRSAFPVSKKQIITPNSYWVITEDLQKLLKDFPHTPVSQVIEVKAMPQMNDDQGRLQLYTTEKKIDEIIYNENQHSLFIRDPEGISLERTSMAIPSLDPANWVSASRESGYGTPGSANSQSADSLNSKIILDIYPRVFSPDNDGFDDAVRFNYQTTEIGMYANLILYNHSGMPIVHLMENELIGPKGSIYWDGRYNNGTIASMGYYFVVFQLFNMKGEKIIIKDKLVLARKL